MKLSDATLGDCAELVREVVQEEMDKFFKLMVWGFFGLAVINWVLKKLGWW